MSPLAYRIIESLRGSAEPVLPSQVSVALGVKLSAVNDELTFLKRHGNLVRHSQGDGLLRYTLSEEGRQVKAPAGSNAAPVVIRALGAVKPSGLPPSRKAAPKQAAVLAMIPTDGSAVTAADIVACAKGAFTPKQVASILQELRIKGLVRSAGMGTRGPAAIWVRTSTGTQPVVADYRRLQNLVLGVQKNMSVTIQAAEGEPDLSLLAKLIAANSLIADAAALIHRRVSL